MLKAIKKLLNGSVSVGNHSVCRNNNEAYFMYHGNVIARINNDDKTIATSHCGYNTSSTSRAINDYKHYFIDSLGYKLISDN